MVMVMGVLNVTPDSFSDGGRFLEPEAALAHGRRLFAEGADIVDVGGESTRPGSQSVSLDEELRRVVPVVRALAPFGRVSIDTSKADVAEAAVHAGATMINDVGASLHELAARLGVAWIAMHMRGTPRTMQEDPRYDDVVGEVAGFLAERAARAARAGVPEVWVDPGLGFGKTADHNLSLLKHLGDLAAGGHPVLVGASRKAFIGRIAGGGGESDRLEGSLAVAVWAAIHGAAMVRVHDVGATVQALRVVGSTPEMRSTGS